MATHFEQIIARGIHFSPQLRKIDTDQVARAFADLTGDHHCV